MVTAAYIAVAGVLHGRDCLTAFHTVLLSLLQFVLQAAPGVAWPVDIAELKLK
jgi:hypothetical protein